MIAGGQECQEYCQQVSYYRTAEEKPRLQIQEDQVLFLFFYEEGKAVGRYGAA